MHFLHPHLIEGDIGSLTGQLNVVVSGADNCLAGEVPGQMDRAEVLFSVVPECGTITSASLLAFVLPPLLLQ